LASNYFLQSRRFGECFPPPPVLAENIFVKLLSDALSDNGTDSRSEIMPATGIFFRATSGELKLDWHNAPRRQYIILLKGQSEVIVGDGALRHFGPEDVMLAEDTSGRGHITRAVNDQPRMSIFITAD
jgi:hypothetical protein